MTLNSVIAALQRLVPLVGDAEVVLHDIATGAETVIQTLAVDLGAGGDATGSQVTVKHGVAPAAPAPAPEAAPAASEATPAASDPNA